MAMKMGRPAAPDTKALEAFIGKAPADPSPEKDPETMEKISLNIRRGLLDDIDKAAKAQDFTRRRWMTQAFLEKLLREG